SDRTLIEVSLCLGTPRILRLPPSCHGAFEHRGDDVELSPPVADRHAAAVDHLGATIAELLEMRMQPSPERAPAGNKR
ncbi:MAG: hypothetical protein O7G30_16655, partial [Proteobacteria bacterium]|nr:hypothetical protein [Pseudomonadota bacterium]